jgi:transcriptional regulator with XRE-family HTH domain
MLTMYSSPLLRRVQLLVIHRPASLKMGELAHDVGVSRVWLSEFAHGRQGNPSAVVLEKLYTRLTGKQIFNDEL